MVVFMYVYVCFANVWFCLRELRLGRWLCAIQLSLSVGGGVIALDDVHLNCDALERKHREATENSIHAAMLLYLANATS